MYRVAIITLFALVMLTVAARAKGQGVSGDEFYAQGRYQEAAVEYQNELSREPNSARLHTNLACAFYHLGLYEDATKELHRALEFNPETPQAARIHYNIGNCYFTTSRLNEAIEAYKTALRLNPN